MKSDDRGVSLPLSVCLQLGQIFDTSVGMTGNFNPAVRNLFSLSPLHEVLEVTVPQDKSSSPTWMDPL